MNQARLYTLRLHESPVQNESNYDRFAMSWVLVDDGGSLVPKIPSEEASVGEKESRNEWKPIQEGDVIYFPELLSGAGEFEGMRFVGKRLHDTELRLLKGGIESPLFPREILEMQSSQPIQSPNDDDTCTNKTLRLRSSYEEVFETMLRKQGCSLTLNDVFGGDAEQFWSNPDVQRQNERRLTEVEEWKIPLDQCTWLS